MTAQKELFTCKWMGLELEGTGRPALALGPQVEVGLGAADVAGVAEGGGAEAEPDCDIAAEAALG